MPHGDSHRVNPAMIPLGGNDLQFQIKRFPLLDGALDARSILGAEVGA